MGLVLSATVICFFIGIPVALVGLVLSIIGLRQANERGAPRGLAIAGISCAGVGLVIGVIILVAVLVTEDSNIDFKIGTTSMLVAPLER